LGNGKHGNTILFTKVLCEFNGPSTDATEYANDGSAQQSKWDIRFDWILEGRAVQDLWITPIRENKTVEWQQPGNRCSTTIRMYDPTIDAWHILWVNPPNGYIIRQIGRQVGNEIVQLGEPYGQGQQSRWVYRDIQADSFRWCNEKTVDNGNTWKLMQEIRAKRVYPYR
jgi:hypothetical protein